MLNASDLSFNKICDILSEAQISVSDFFQTLENPSPIEKKLTPQQEEYFSQHPHVYNFFHELLRLDLDWKKLKAIHGLNQKSIDQYLLKLDKLGVVELHPGNKVKSDFANNCRIVFGAKLAKLVIDRKHQALLDFAHIPNEKFHGKKHLASGTLKLSPASATEFNRALRDVISEYMNRSKRENVVEPSSNLEDIGFLVVVTPTQGMPLEQISNL